MWSYVITILSAVVGVTGGVYAVTAYLRRSAETETDLKSATSAVSDARDRVLAMEAAEDVARRRRIEAVNAQATAAATPSAAADLLRSVTNSSPTGTAKVSDSGNSDSPSA